MKTVLMVAFHFPPAAMGSGHLRTLGFVRHLPDCGWDTIVLSASLGAYPNTDVANNELIPPGCEVHRAFALDAGRHMAICGKYPGFLAKPDRWISWWAPAVWQGLRLIRRHRVSAIWSTYPVMSAHRIAQTLSRLTGLPWIADFRDPVVSSVSGANAFALTSQKCSERRVMARASGVVFTTPSALRSYAHEYPAVFEQGRMSVIPNGYDEAAFADLPAPATYAAGRPLRMVHSGLLYPDGRNPLPLFTALASLKAANALTASDINIVLRASGSEARYAEDLRRLELGDIVTLAPAISNRAALREQAEADALLLIQGSRFDRQIPAKVYEYLRIGRPIFALVGQGGDTAVLLQETGGAQVASLDSVLGIRDSLLEFVRAVRAQKAPMANVNVVRRFSRASGAATLANLLDGVPSEHGGNVAR